MGKGEKDPYSECMKNENTIDWLICMLYLLIYINETNFEIKINFKILNILELLPW